MTGPILTVPNVISAVRVAMVPLFLWLLFGADAPLAAGKRPVKPSPTVAITGKGV